MSHLGNVGRLKDLLCNELLALLDSLKGKNLLLVWDKPLMTPVNMVVDTNSLKQHKVHTMYSIEATGSIGTVPAECDMAVFLVRPDPTIIKYVATYVNDKSKLPTSKSAAIVFVPNKTIPCENLLRELKVDLNRVQLTEFQLDLLPFDNDLLLCDWPNAFRDYHLKSDISSLHYLSRAIMKIQTVFGIIPNIACKGEAAKRVCDNIIRMRREYDLEDTAAIAPQIDNLIIIDRSCDPLTPLVPQLNFEGLIEEVYRPKYTRIVVSIPRDNDVEERKVALNSADEVFADLRDRHINAIGKLLSKFARNISAQFDERHQATTVAELKKIVSKLPHMQAAKNSLAVFTTVTEKVKAHTESDEYMDLYECQHELVHGYETDRANPFIESLIAARVPCRTCCGSSAFSHSATAASSPNWPSSLRSRQAGHVCNLVKAGLIAEQKPGARNHYSAIKTTLSLCPEQLSEEAPADFHYVTSGYAPISARLVQKFSQPGWRGIRDALDFLPGGPVHEAIQKVKGLRQDGPVPPVYSADTKHNLVVFVGAPPILKSARFASCPSRTISQLTTSSSPQAC
uniref:Vacuolar sorting protein vps15 n=1 Tax=Macrostomum lignano TaxID=282301 RepID=A0A1I8HV09_9PLAT